MLVMPLEQAKQLAVQGILDHFRENGELIMDNLRNPVAPGRRPKK